MKLFFLSLLTVFIFGAAGAQETTAAPEPLRFKETEHNFGKIPQSKPVYHVFEMVNESNAPVALENVQAACGCTTPEWSRDAIAPKATAKIKVGFNAAAEGIFSKPISVVYSGITKVLYIKGEVWKTPATSAPENASVQFLKKQLQP